jgi:tetratricopeptide (TPR) repeat protein
MFRSRLILLIVIVFSIVLLYNLPRVVVDNSAPAMETSADLADPEAVIKPEDQEQAHRHHAPEVPDSLTETILNLREMLFSLQNQEKRLIFADSLARLFEFVGNYDSAARYYELKASLLPGADQYLETADALYRALSFSIDQGQRINLAKKARTYYLKVLEEKPDEPDVQVKLGMTYVSGDDPMTGIQMIRKVAEAHPENELALYQLGMLSVTTGQYDKAIDRFRKLIGQNAGHGEARFYLGYCFFEIEEYDKAREEFNKVMTMDVSNELMEAAKKYLENINNI